MKFYLSHVGNISTRGHVVEKFKLRRHFHTQLKTLHDYLIENDVPLEHSFCVEKLRHVEAFRFLPLVTKASKKVVDLDIVLLSHDEPASTKDYPTCDVDNMLKALLDGLRMAQNKNEIRNEKPKEDEDPFYSLLEDDQFVRNVTIKHDKLLFPVQKKSKKGEVFVLIKVNISPKYQY